MYIINRKGALNWSRKVERQLRYPSGDTSDEALTHIDVAGDCQLEPGSISSFRSDSCESHCFMLNTYYQKIFARAF